MTTPNISYVTENTVERFFNFISNITILQICSFTPHTDAFCCANATTPTSSSTSNASTVTNISTITITKYYILYNHTFLPHPAASLGVVKCFLSAMRCTVLGPKTSGLSKTDNPTSVTNIDPTTTKRNTGTHRDSDQAVLHLLFTERETERQECVRGQR